MIFKDYPQWRHPGSGFYPWDLLNPFLLVAKLPEYPDPTKAPVLKQWVRDYWEAVHPFNLEGAYANFMMDDEGEARVKAAYGDNYHRLAALKERYDPNNLFRSNQNIRPAGQETAIHRRSLAMSA